MMKPLTTSVYTFSNLVEGGFLYVDKTAGLHQLIRPAFGQYFLSRPRRFGKSLLISTLKSIFLGKRELFTGLAITDTDYDWQTYPVIHLDLGDRAAGTPEELDESLCDCLDEQAQEYSITLTKTRAAARFRELILAHHRERGKVVILIDEYDKPLLGHLGQESAGDIQRVLKGFYAVIKGTEAQQRFVLITGVSKFSKVSIFSDLNNLTDLTMNRSCATLLGYTQEELEANFPDYIQRLATTLDLSVEQALAELRSWYNGYCFHQDAETVYNPVSLMKCLMDAEFKNYWFETGTPTFLIELLRRQPVDMADLSVPESAFSTYEPNNLHPLPLLVQTGYLTIKKSEQMGAIRYYHLGYPNCEIEQSFNYWLARDMSNLPDPELSGALLGLCKALQSGRIEEMLELLKTFFHNIPNTIAVDQEKYYQTIFFTVFKLIGAMIGAEVSTGIGRIDAVVKTANGIFIFEFKLRGTAEDAMRQIHEKQYAAPYRDDPRPVTLVGVEFNRQTRNIGQWLIEAASK